MTIPCGILTLESQKFEECPAGSGQVAVRTTICQEPGTAISVEVTDDGDKGTVTATYNEVGSVPSATITDVVSYTVPIGKIFFLKEIEYSGDSRAEYTIEIDASTEAKRRATWTNWDGEFRFYNQKLTAGQVVKLRVDHCSPTSGEFNGRIIGNLV